MSEAGVRRCLAVRRRLIEDGLFAEAPDAPVGTTWRIAPDPFPLSSDDLAFFHSLGDRLLAFYRALNHLYLDSVRGAQPAWIAAYLDQGKPDSLVTYARMKRFRDHVPAVIRPDVIPTAEGMIISELDSVPGGIGLTAALGRAYAEVIRRPSSASPGLSTQHSALSTSSGSPPSPHASRLTPHAVDIVGGADGMVAGFESMVKEQMAGSTGCVAIVVSDEAKDYRPEMRWLAAALRDRGCDAVCVEPREVRFAEEGLSLADGDANRPIALLYRFFELFDLPNVSKSELVMYSAKKERVVVTPPFKPALEEKLAFALLHHPALTSAWTRLLGEETFRWLSGVFPRTWILDPRPIPPAAVIPGLALSGNAVADWKALAGAGQKERRFVIKPSGFSELAWGSRGVSIGHDLPQAEWAEALDRALAAFPKTPYVLQEFHKGKAFDLAYHDAGAGDLVPMAGRARLSPYYFVVEGRARLAGILATVCSLDKKVIHGMKDAVMAPCAVDTTGDK
jgi:hypothetical protein